MSFLPILTAIAPSLLNGISSGMQNATMNMLNNQQEGFQTSMYADQLAHQEQMQLQSNAFDQMMDERSENMREVNTLRDVDMSQRKADNDITKKFIQSITE